ncbi:flagella basal body P-ring formation protein FlgA [Halopseudomonas xinjiangensis]|uniref:Flagella basal body P-ring formation protein FlgA n=1 Tax=Halopseudomonas xinjiangensis TaxID=487184 RepID=A0A1H1U5F0_9GAMM|nr:flagellar basal body P-ring formation chaperone FlgA [Halopseudomonas xinjiangensis]SDS67654.1 flagella basal body P-ring formation protein FlgA [Halopseudomonas xinjiangensis]
MRFIRHCAALAIFFSAGSSANPLIEQLIGTTEAFLEEQAERHVSASARDARYEIEVGRLDPRLRLPLCPPEAIAATLESPAAPVGRVTVRVSCESDEARWRLFVPAKVSLFEQVLVTRRPLARHEVIQPTDMALLERDVGLLGDQYLTDPAQALGKRAKRQLPGDTVIGSNHLENDEVVKRGDKVVISAANSQISVRMPGEALQAGTVGSQIRVRNTRSGRVVTARIIAPGQVEVAM